MLHGVFARPMFDTSPSTDLSAVVVLAVAAVLWFVGFRALIRIAGGEPEVRSFRATGHREPSTILLWAGTAVFGALAVLALVAGWA